jgi:hypothetical protein
VVREGRDQTFLPLPAVASDADGQQQQQKQQQQQQQPQRRVGQAPDPPVLGPTALADLPVDRWLVRNPAAAAAGQGMSLEQVRRAWAVGWDGMRLMKSVGFCGSIMCSYVKASRRQRMGPS